MRLRKPRVHLFGHTNDYGVVLRTDKADKWVMQCFSCNDEHEQSSKSIKANKAPRSCKNFKPHNYSGMSKTELFIHRNYKITLNTYNNLIAVQGGGCAICGKDKDPSGRRLSIDHCHKSGQVRGVLCNQCNNGLGSFGDNISLIHKAIEYLQSPPIHRLEE